ncbi:phosphotransferase [Streptomyces sp. NPDC051940]|uniref:phosphotransferase family protein n=1 Tax=Streptomyces sp. NPDC051940 TaxID=3155675 RepID=UPI00341BB7C5
MDLGPEDFERVYRLALANGEGACGHYHRNIRVDYGGQAVVVRIPEGCVERMDFSIWREGELLRAIEPHTKLSPRLIHEADSYQVHGFLPGFTVADSYPRGTRLPPDITAGVRAAFADMLQVPRRQLPPIRRRWPKDGDTRAFARVLIGHARGLRRAHGRERPALFERLGMPEDPFGALAERLGPRGAGIGRRDFRLLHGDLHRGNLLSNGPGEVYVLDWQLALWGDPVFDLARHLHTTGYSAVQEKAVIREWCDTAAAAPGRCLERWEEALGFYRAYEQVKSSVVDTVRWSRRIEALRRGSDEELAAASELARRVNAGREHWPRFAEADGLTAQEVLHAVRGTRALPR